MNLMNKPCIKTLLLAGFSLLASEGFSQQTLNVAGHSAKINGMTFDYSIGEMTLISTERNANLIVTQGLLQPNGPGSGSDQVNQGNTLSDLTDRINVYPNPTQNILYLELLDAIAGDFAYQLFDGTGKVVLEYKGQLVQGSNRFTLDLGSIAAATYYLMVRKPGSDGQPSTVSYKIQKVN